MRTISALICCLLLAGCAGGPHIGLTITNAPAPQDCYPGSAVKPCQ